MPRKHWKNHPSLRMISDLHAAQIIGEEKDNERTNNKQNDFNEIIRDGRRISAPREFAGVQKNEF